MDRIINSKVDKQSIYEIYRACRLCGAGAGYKMPIIQNVVDVDDEVELKQKIRECVQIEVHQDDKMPPLICELCVDKVNDFYEFLDMCRQTNKKTRLRLGLPPQTMPRGAPDAGDCILGVTEPVYVNDDEDDDQPLSKGSTRNSKLRNSKTNTAKKPELRVKVENSVAPRHTRHDRRRHENMSLSDFKKQDRKSKALPPPPAKSILKRGREIKQEETSPTLRSKRTREPPKPEIPQKRVKLSVKPPPKPALRQGLKQSNRAPLRPPPPPRRPEPQRKPSPPPVYYCSVCKQKSKTPQPNITHMRTHTVTFTSNRLACNACGEWFATTEETNIHHKRHKSKPYICRGCKGRYNTYTAYQQHTRDNECVPWTEVPDVKCGECWRLYPTQPLLERHKCQGEDGRPGGKCFKCNRSYALLKNLKKHESTCTTKKKGEVVIAPEIQETLKPLQVRVARCDPLLVNVKREHYDVSAVTQNFGLDSTCVYPYINSSLKFDRMVNIKSELDDFYCEEDYIHWDSDVSTDDDVTEVRERQVHSLSTLTLKTIFSMKCLGRVPRKRRKVKPEKSVFDNLMNNDFDDDMSKNIENIIDNLNDGDDEKIDDSTEKKDESVENNSSDKINDISVEKMDDSDVNKDKIDVASENISNDNDKNNESETKEENDKSVDVALEEKQDDLEDKDKSLSNEATNSSNEAIENTKSIEEEKSPVNSEENDESNKLKEINIQSEVAAENANNESVDKDSRTEESNNPDSVEESKKECSVNDIQSEIDKNVNTNEILPADNSVMDNDESSVSSRNNDITENTINDEKVEDVSTETLKESKEIEQNNDESVDSRKTNFDTEKLDDKDSNISKEQSVKEMDDKEKSPENVQENRLSSDSGNDLKDSLDDKNVSDTKNMGNTNNDLVKSRKEDENALESDKNNDSENTHNDKVNGDVEEKSDKLNMEDFNEPCEGEIDDKKLMDALNEHIGESNSENNEKETSNNKDNSNNDNGNSNNDNKNTINDRSKDDDENVNNDVRNADNKSEEKDKITLEDLIPKDHDARSMDLDSISDDDFNFDA